MGRALFLILLILSGVQSALCQDVSSLMTPSVTVSFEASPNVDATLKTTEGERLSRGRVEDVTTTRISATVGLFHKQLNPEKRDMIAVLANPFYEFSTTGLSRELDVSGYELNMPSTHHYYGLNIMAIYSGSAFDKPLFVMAMPFINFSQYGYERVGGILCGALMLKRSQSTRLGIGAVLLLGTTSSWPLFPFVTYYHKFDNAWSINIQGAYNTVNYSLGEHITLKGVLGIRSPRYFMHTDGENLPKKAVWRQTNVRTGVQCDCDVSQHVAITLLTGVDLPMSGRVYNHNGSKKFARLRTKPLPVLTATLRYKL